MGIYRYQYVRYQYEIYSKCTHLGKKIFLSSLQTNFKRQAMSTNSYTNNMVDKVSLHKAVLPNNLPDWTRMVWVDCEMTGLDTKVDTLLEVAVLVTDSDLNIVAEGPNIVIHHPEEVLTCMNDWCIEHHGKSGLTQMVRDSKIRFVKKLCNIIYRSEY